MSLLDQNTWWILPYVCLCLFMVYAMLEFTVAILAKRPPVDLKPVGGAELRQRLLTLNTGDRPFQLVEGKDCGHELHWNVVDTSWYEIFAKVKLSMIYRARMLLDEARHELRWFESIRSSNLFLGFDGWRPRFNWSFYARWGYINVIWTGLAYGIKPGFPPRIGQVYNFHLDTVQPKKEIRAIVTQSGWTFRPVLWWFQVKRRGHQVSQPIKPSPMKRCSTRLFWGILYPASYFLSMGYIIVILWPVNSHNLLVIGCISALWWGSWGAAT